MIIDTLAHASLYAGIHPQFKTAFAFLSRPCLESATDGKTVLAEPDKVFANIQTYMTKPLEGGSMEAHKKYIDVQYIVSGEEWIGWAPFGGQKVVTPFDAGKDIGFYSGETSLLHLRAGMFAIFFPQDAHMPCRFIKTACEVKKIVVKVAV
jgi:YhcH/YjgK/YiaL family protein